MIRGARGEAPHTKGTRLDEVRHRAVVPAASLPSDRDFLEARVETSVRSFADAVDDWRAGVYVFVLEDTGAQRVVGTSTILAKHGRPGVPYFWLGETTEERRSAELGKSFVHKKLQLHSSEDGPTEIGGLILDPAYRNHREKCGKALSIVRLAYISMHPEHFEREIIAEMLSPFEAPGVNRLWDAFGARFTALPYREADHLSSRSKQFPSATCRWTSTSASIGA